MEKLFFAAIWFYLHFFFFGMENNYFDLSGGLLYKEKSTILLLIQCANEPVLLSAAPLKNSSGRELEGPPVEMHTTRPRHNGAFVFINTYIDFEKSAYTVRSRFSTRDYSLNQTVAL